MDTTTIFPQVKPMSFIEANTDVVSRPLIPGIATCFVIDAADTMQYVNTSQLEELHMSVDELYSTALNNLRNLEGTKTGMRVMDHPDGTKAISFETGDSYDASRIHLMFRDKLDEFIEILGDPFLVIIPCRDFLLAVPASMENKLAGYAKELFNSKDNPISSGIYMFSKKQETFTPTT
jgi:uncharacterized protein YtpQ (UPF0354 family)